jgi:hypothetical protein
MQSEPLIGSRHRARIAWTIPASMSDGSPT